MSKQCEIYIAITTYDRPKEFQTLMDDISRETKGRNVHIHVYDDASPIKYTDANGYDLTRYKTNRGKQRYWLTVNDIFRDAETCKFDYFFQLPDDCRLVPGFFDEAIRLWNKIPDKQKICLNTLLIKERLEIQNWTRFKPQEVSISGDRVIKTQWNDMCYLCTSEFFKVLDWKIKEIDERRWLRDKNLSSGVGQQITQRLDALRRNMYHVWDSLVIMGGDHDSKMNGIERLRHPHTSLHRKEKKSLGVASVPDRSDSLVQTINSLYDQVDEIHVFLNGYKIVPKELHKSKIKIYTSQEFGDMGDAGKFFKVGECTGYYFSVDDDIIYPKDYVQKTIEKIEMFGRKYVVSYHGAILLNPPVHSYYKGRKQLHCLHKQGNDIPVHVGGTGVMAFHTSTIHVQYEDFRLPNMADIWMALACQKKKVGIMCLAREGGWITLSSLIDESKTIYANKSNHDVQTETVNSWKNWAIHATAETVSNEFVLSELLLVKKEKVTIGIASIKSRESALQRTIQSLINQVDHIHVYLNDYDKVPLFIQNNSKITFYLGKIFKDRGDTAKYYAIDKVQEGYYFSCDDDLLYPENYVEKTITYLQSKNNRFIATYHGALLRNGKLSNYYRDRKQIHYSHFQRMPSPVHIGGTGVMAFHIKTFKPDIKAFKYQNMADIWVGIQAQEQKIPIICSPRPLNWIKPIPVSVNEGIFSSKKNHDIQTQVINDWKATHGEFKLNNL